MKRYQYGDIVRVKDWFDECEAVFVDEMKPFFGKEVTIAKVEEGSGFYKINEDGCRWWWSDDCFEGLVAPEDENAISLEGLL